MAEVQQQPNPTEPVPKRRILRSLAWIFALFILSLVLVLGYMFSTDRGSRFLLDRVLERQNMIQYQYVQGNLLKGIVLKNIIVNLKTVNVEIAHADVELGWRAIVNKEIHLKDANTENLIVRLKGEPDPNPQPFAFPKIALPFVLRIDQANIDHLTIITKAKTEVDFYHIYLNDTVWSKTKIDFEKIAVDMGYLNVRDATGFIDFKDKYPLKLDGIVNLPSLRGSLNIHDIQVAARGTLDTIRAGVATESPDLLKGWAIVQPMRDMVPMFGQLKFNQYHLPLFVEQKLYIEQGLLDFKGNYEGFDLALNTSLLGENIPEGQYQANMYVDFVNALHIHQLNASLMQGSAELTGRVDWSENVTWDLQGRLNDLNRKDKRIPEIVEAFLPAHLAANISSKGSLANGMQLSALVDFDRDETWRLNLNQAAAKSDEKAEPMLLNVQWQSIDRAMPYIGWLKSDSGDVKLRLDDAAQNIKVATSVAQHESGTLPAGRYQADLNLKNQRLSIPNFIYQAQQGALQGRAEIDLPTEKRALKWSAQLQANQFNPQTVHAAAPVDFISGRLDAAGQAGINQQLIQLKNIDLNGRVAGKSEMIHLSGQSTAALLFKTPEQGGGFKSFAVNYDGALKASQTDVSQGLLKIRVAGTPELIQIHEFQHDGIAGKMNAKAALNLKNGIAWNADASLIRFKPEYFVSSLKGELSGNVKTQGMWSDALKRIQIERLNLAGMLNNKPVRGTGQLSMLLNHKNDQWLPSQFSASQLFLSYASNQIQVTGNEENLAFKVNAPRLNELYPGLLGRAYGFINVKTQPRLTATTNLAVDGFAFRDLIKIQKLKIEGDLPTSDVTPSHLVASLQQLRNGQREIQQGEIRLSGTYGAHLLTLQARNRLSELYVQLAGGFNAQKNWVGQIQKGDFDSLRTRLVQRQNASIMYNPNQKSFFLGAHCWMSQQSEICVDQPIRFSPQGGAASITTRNVDLNDFAAFMPEGLSITGKVNGYAKATWQQGQRPKIDVRLLTRDGKVGLSDSQELQASSSLSYTEVGLVAKSVSQGLQLRLDVNTPDIGTGYANVVIDPYQERKPMTGEVAFDRIDLKVFKPFLADVRELKGSLSYAGKIRGYLTEPEIDGELRVKDAAISMLSLPVDLNNIQLYAHVKQDTATIKGAFNAGRGVGQIDGRATWANEPHIQLQLKGNNLLVRQVPMIQALVSPDLKLDVYPSKKELKLLGKVDVPRADISMPEVSANVVNVSPDVRVVRVGDNQLELLKKARPWKVDADIDVLFVQRDKVFFNGFNSRIPLVGSLQLTQRGLETAMRAKGAIGVTSQVNVEAYGQSLTIQRAIARFSGPLANPSLDIDANKTVQGNVVGLRISGVVANPNIQIYSDAGLSEQEALNALITGRIDEGSSNLNQTEGFRSDVNNTIAAAGISMGLGGTRALTNQIGRTFGLSGLALDAQGTGDDTQVSVTGYLTPDLFIRYGVGVFTPVNKLTLRYQMNRRLYLEASQSLERAVDVFYNWRF